MQKLIGVPKPQADGRRFIYNRYTFVRVQYRQKKNALKCSI